MPKKNKKAKVKVLRVDQRIDALNQRITNLERSFSGVLNKVNELAANQIGFYSLLEASIQTLVNRGVFTKQELIDVRDKMDAETAESVEQMRQARAAAQAKAAEEAKKAKEGPKTVEEAMEAKQQVSPS